MEKHFSRIPIPEGHKLVDKGLEWKGARKGQDTDVYYYDEVNEAGEVVASYEVTDSMSTYPPFQSRISVEKLKPSGE